MMKQTDRLITKIFRESFLFIEEKKYLALLYISFVLVFGVPLIKYLQKIVSEIPYSQIATAIIGFFNKNYGISSYINLLLVTLSFYAIARLVNEINKTNTIIECFKNNDLNKWNLPLRADWSIEKLKDTSGQVLQVKYSKPGTLKEAYWWYDYETNFEAKFVSHDKDIPVEFSVILRATNNSSGIILTFKQTKFSSYILYDNTEIYHEEQSLPTTLPNNEWLKTLIIVKGNLIEILIHGQKIFYKIPNELLEMDTSEYAKLSNQFDKKVDLSLTALRSLHKQRNDLKKSLISLYDKFDNTKDPVEKDKIDKQIDAKIDLYSKPTTKMYLQFPSGSFGLLQHKDTNPAYFRNIKVKKIVVPS